MVGAWAGRRVLDLYAGSGAVGLEALSRGADHCLLVESEPKALATVRANVTTLALPGADVHGGKVERLVSGRPPGAPYDVVFLDPPYDLGDDALREVLVSLGDHGWLAPAALIAVERPTRGGPWEWPAGIQPERSRRYGEATLWYGRAALESAGE
jgi:16S rRNA (guanine966-N2)-methyltransferase